LLAALRIGFGIGVAILDAGRIDILARVQIASARQGTFPRGRQGTKTLVVGCGFIGSRTAEELNAAGVPTAVLTRSDPVSAIGEVIAEADLHLGDASDPAVLGPALEEVGAVIYTAGGLLPAASELEPERDAELTLDPLRAVLAALRGRPGTTFLYLSSGGTVYGEPAANPVTEDAQLRPLGSYGRLHVQCEAEILRERDEHGLAARILRCSTVYGERQRPERGQGAIVTFLHRVATGIPIDLYGGGTSIRDYIYVGDVARVLVALANRDDGPPVVNVGSGEGTSLADLLTLVESEIGRPAEVIDHGARDFEVDRIVLDVSRLQSLVQMKPTPLPEGIAYTWDWLRRATPELA
jgi:UDP-glucose 4-epimerase